jgi:hypothetical protein
VIICHSREIGKYLLLCYHMDYIYIIIGDRAGRHLVLDLDRQQSEALVALVPPVSIRTVRCNGRESSHRSYYPEHILAYGSGKTRSFRVLVSSSFRVDCMEAGTGWRSKDHTESGTRVVVAWSPSLGRGPGNLDRNGRG